MGISGIKKFCRKHKGAALALAAYTGCNSESTIYNWIKRNHVPKRKRHLVQKFVSSKKTTIHIFTENDRKGVTRKWGDK